VSTHKLSASPPSSGRESRDAQAKDEYAFALHEVSNALTVVLGWLDLGARAESEDELKRALGVAREHAKRGQILARRAIGAEAESTRGGRSAREIVEFVAVSLRPAAIERGISIEWNAQPGTDGTVNDEASLVQVLTNLLLNAVQFSPAGSAVQLTASRRGDEVAFVVQDHGPGIEFERRDCLFSRPTTTREGGAGLGLAHSRALARDRNGDLSYVPTPQGACFEARWPIARSTAVRPSVRASALDALVGARLLLIEDDLAVSSLVELSCEARGAEVIAVHDAEQLSSVLSGRPVLDVVLMDLSPIEHCLVECLDELAELAPGAPIVLMSGQPNGVPAGGEGRFATWIRKPFDMEQLIQSVADLLRERPASG